MGSSLAMWSEYFPYGTIVGEAELTGCARFIIGYRLNLIEMKFICHCSGLVVCCLL